LRRPLERLLGDRRFQFLFQPFPFGGGPLAGQFTDQFIQRLQGAIPFGKELLRFDLLQRFDLLSGIGKHREGLIVIALTGGKHGARRGVNPQDIGPPLLQTGLVRVLLRMFVDKTKQTHIPFRIGDDPLVFLDLQQKDITPVDAGTFIEQLLAGISVKMKRATSLPFPFTYRLVVIEDEVCVVWTFAIRPTIEVDLQDALKCSLIHPHLDLGDTILTLDLAHIGFRIEFPFVQKPGYVCRHLASSVIVVRYPALGRVSIRGFTHRLTLRITASTFRCDNFVARSLFHYIFVSLSRSSQEKFVAKTQTTAATDHQQLAVLLEVGEVLGAAANFEQALYEILQVLCNRLQMRLGTLSLLRGEQEVAIDIAYGLSQDEIDRGRYKVGEGITGRVVASAKPVIVPRISSEPLFLDRTGARTSHEKSQSSFICVPIALQREVVGTLSADCPYVDDSRLQANVRLLTIVAAMVAQNVATRRRARAEWANLADENQRLQTELKERFHPTNIIGNSRPMEEVGGLIGKVAPSDATVLLRGESGTGKELVADAIHYHSLRSGQPLVRVHIAALPETLVEAELFGHEKGAFTGATEASVGRFERADGGTLFLDEIGELPIGVQVKLLRVLQTRQIERLGSSESHQIDVRIIAATHVDLEKAVAAGTFREDLYYRLNVFPIYVPPLRERKSDILLLADTFLDQYGRKHSKQMRRISTPAIDMLMSYHWPGNVRELENCIERAIILSVDGVVHGHHLPPSLQTAASSGTDLSGSLEMMMSSYEREIIVEALKNTKGNMARAARLLGTTSRIFTYRTKSLDISPRQYRR